MAPSGNELDRPGKGPAASKHQLGGGKTDFGRCVRSAAGTRENNERICHELRYRVAIRFAIAGDLRFISHHDTMRLFERALARAGLPVKFSQGFNPRPRLSLPLPRPVGVASDCDVVVVELNEPVVTGEMLEQLALQMPEGLQLTAADPLEGGRAPQPESVEYVLPLGPGEPPELAAAVKRLKAAASWPMRRSDSDGRSRTIDVRPMLLGIELDSGVLRWSARTGGGGSIRSSEVLAAVGLDPQVWHHRIQRSSIRWSQPWGGTSAPSGNPG